MDWVQVRYGKCPRRNNLDVSHKANLPDLVVNLFDSYFLTAEHSTDTDFSPV